jgi:hypothetical protein
MCPSSYDAKDNHTESIPTGSLSMVFSVEVMPILTCAELIFVKNVMTGTVHICCDSRAAIVTLEIGLGMHASSRKTM